MAMDVKITVEKSEALQRWLAERRRLLRSTTAGTLRSVLTEAVRYGRERHLTGGMGSPRVRSGRLRRSFRMVVNPREGVIRGRLGFMGRGARYAWTQEYGADITPKNRRFLLIPLAAALTPTGRRSARVQRLIAEGKTFVKGRVIYERRGPRQAPVPLFVLSKGVRVPARPALAATWQLFRPRLLARLERDTTKLFLTSSAG